jgi:hypothetical protein
MERAEGGRGLVANARRRGLENLPAALSKKLTEWTEVLELASTNLWRWAEPTAAGLVSLMYGAQARNVFPGGAD